MQALLTGLSVETISLIEKRCASSMLFICNQLADILFAERLGSLQNSAKQYKRRRSG